MSTPHTMVCCSTGMLINSGRAARSLSISNPSGKFTKVTLAGTSTVNLACGCQLSCSSRGTRPGALADGICRAQKRVCALQSCRGLAESSKRCCRDIFTVRLTPSEQAVEAAGSTESRAPFMCPITDLSCLRFPMSALPDCGHAFSSRALAQVSALAR